MCKQNFCCRGAHTRLNLLILAGGGPHGIQITLLERSGPKKYLHFHNISLINASENYALW